jgi:hypothetical protein
MACALRRYGVTDSGLMQSQHVFPLGVLTAKGQDY